MLVKGGSSLLSSFISKPREFYTQQEEMEEDLLQESSLDRDGCISVALDLPGVFTTCGSHVATSGMQVCESPQDFCAKADSDSVS